jgi:hypothetical protein
VLILRLNLGSRVLDLTGLVDVTVLDCSNRESVTDPNRRLKKNSIAVFSSQQHVILLFAPIMILTHCILLPVLARSVEGGKIKNTLCQKGQRISSPKIWEAGGNF